MARDGLGHEYALSHDRQLKILDLGTGTGIWSIHVAECVLLFGSATFLTRD